MLRTEFIPARKRDSKNLMIVLHGLGDSSAGYQWLPEAMNLDWMNYLLVNAPDPYFNGFSWYDYAGVPGPTIIRSRNLLFNLLDSQRKSGIPTENTTLFGFSQGCLMTMEVGLRYPHRLAGLVGISGYVFEPTKALTELSPVAKQQRFLVTHGLMDPIIPFPKAKSHFDELKAGGINISWHEFRKEHTIAGEAEMSVIREFVKEGYPDTATAGK